jgi:hypothetical protein
VARGVTGFYGDGTPFTTFYVGTVARSPMAFVESVER